MKKTASPGAGRGLGLSILAAGALVSISVSMLPGDTGADRWYIIKIAGNPAGYVHEVVEEKAAPEAKAKSAPQAKTAPAPRLLVTTSDMRLVLNRLGSRIELRFLSSADESAEGRLLRTEYVMLASNQSTKSTAVVDDGKIEVTSEAAGKAYTNVLTFTGTLFGPEAIRRGCAQALRKPGDRITIQTFVPEANLVGNLTRVVLSRDTVILEGRPFPAVKVEETLEGMPIKRTGWLDLDGNLLKQEEPGPFGLMEVARAEKDAAMAAAAGVELPAEIYQKSIVRTNIRLPRYAPIDRLKLRLTHRDPALGWPDFKGGNQTVIEKTEKQLVLEMRRPAAPKDLRFPAAAADEATRQYLEPNAYVQSDDAEIRQLARKLAGREKDAFQAVLAMERWVAEHMTFDLGIVFAPAVEVFQSRRGTCVGYATILATLARAAGVPSRVAMGYVYAQGMFGGHAWAEIFSGREWIPVDAAIVNAGVADATHVRVMASSLAGGPGEMSIGPAQQIFGQVDISILEYDTDKRTTVVPPDAKPYTVEGNRYVNPWLSITLAKPPDFVFAKLDAIWPDPTVVGLMGPNGEKVSLEEQPVYPWESAGRAAAERVRRLVPKPKSGQSSLGERLADRWTEVLRSTDGRTAAAAFARDQATCDLLVLKVEGPDAERILRQIAESLRLGSPYD